jgi:hypothetical protein
LILTEFNSSGIELTATTFTAGGAVPQTDKVIGAGVDSTSSARDVILATNTGQTIVYDVSGITLSAQSGVVATTQSDGSVVVVGTSAVNTFNAGSATTTLIGNGGNDIYDLASSFTSTTIVNGLSGNSASGTMAFLSPSVGTTNVWFDRVNDQGVVSSTGNNLRVDVLGTNHSVVVDSWFTGGGGQQALAEIEVTAGTPKFIDTGLTSLMAAMSTYETNNPSFNPMTAPSTITNSTVLSAVNAAWHV